jgi:copper chaperone CopZ
MNHVPPVSTVTSDHEKGTVTVTFDERVVPDKVRHPLFVAIYAMWRMCR